MEKRMLDEPYRWVRFIGWLSAFVALFQFSWFAVPWFMVGFGSLYLFSFFAHMAINESLVLLWFLGFFVLSFGLFCFWMEVVIPRYLRKKRIPSF